MTTAVSTTPDALKPRMTMVEFRALPEGPPHFEFEKGKLIPMTSPTSRHQKVLLVLCAALFEFVRNHRLGDVFMEVDVFLPDKDHAYIPDISYLSISSLRLLDEQDQKIHGAPDLTVEILSSEPYRDRVEKFRAYFENGVTWYWIVDPDSLSIEEYHATADGYVRTASVLPGEVFRPKLLEGLDINLAQLVAPAPQSEPQK